MNPEQVQIYVYIAEDNTIKLLTAVIFASSY
jgi:hypothetical protein